MSGKHSRTKGHSFEREIAQDFRKIGFKDAQTRRAARGGDWSHSDDGIDLVGTGRYSVQCKRLANYVSVNTIDEIQGESIECSPRIVGINPNTGRLVFSKGEPIEPIPILLTKADRKETMAILPWKDLQRMIYAYEDTGK